MRGGAIAKSTFVTAPSFASSSSVTSINHVPRASRFPPGTPRFWPTHATRPIAAHPIFRHRPIPFPFYQFLPFFLSAFIRATRKRALAHITPEVHLSDKNEISWAILSDLCYLRNFSSASIISRREWSSYFEQRPLRKTLILHHDDNAVAIPSHQTVFLYQIERYEFKKKHVL